MQKWMKEVPPYTIQNIPDKRLQAIGACKNKYI